MQRDENELELSPVFELGDKVRVTRMIRNDGTFPGVPRGTPLLKGGEVGYVASIGTFLQNFYIYGIHFLETNSVIGCRKHELELIEEAYMRVMLRRNANDQLVVYVAKKDLEEEVTSQVESDHGQIFTLANGWQLEVPDLGEPMRLPQTVEARRLA